MYASIAGVAALSVGLRVLLLPAYYSTDMEVHRAWLALTAGRPISEWYWDATSQWTLDYPPLFAFVTRAMAPVASAFAPEALTMSSTAIATPTVVTFMRISAIAADALLLGVLLARVPREAPRGGGGTPGLSAAAAAAAVFCNAGLVLIDGVHFQYNGALIGVAIGVAALLDSGRYVAAAAAFAALLMLKQLFVTLAPVVAVLLLRWYVWPDRGAAGAAASDGARVAGRALLLCATAGAVLCAALGPVLLSGGRHGPAAHGAQLLARLFPFRRGLVHAMWAPNAWAVYMAADRALAAACRAATLQRTAFRPISTVCDTLVAFHGPAAAIDGHLEHQQRTLLLPSVAPAAAAALVLMLQAPVLGLAWRAPRRGAAAALRLLALAYLAAFLCGWHVHEKAVLYALVPALLATAAEPASAGGARRAAAAAAWAREVLLLSVPAHASLFPLFFSPLEQPLLPLLTGVYTATLWLALRQAHGAAALRCDLGTGPYALPARRQAYLCGCALLHVGALASVALLPRLPFLPLGVVAVYCAVGIGEAFARLLRAAADALRAEEGMPTNK